MNPIAEERFSFLVRSCAPASARHALDIGSGKGHASLILARDFGMHTTQVDISAQWTDAAAMLFAANGMTSQTEIVCQDAAHYDIPWHRFDVIVCLGTAAVYGGFAQALHALEAGLTEDGILIVGEATIDRPAPRRYAEHLEEQGWYVHSSKELLRMIERQGCEVLMALRSTEDEWDRYMGLQWTAVSDHARAHPRDLVARSFHGWARDEQEAYLQHQRHVMDWTVFAVRRVKN
jgi:cyclopropane fatty-acyl-phospholipid synthase-like methyltransferase